MHLLFTLLLLFSPVEKVDPTPSQIEQVEKKAIELFRFYYDYPSGCSSKEDVIHCYFFDKKTEDGKQYYIVRGRYSYKCGSSIESTIFMLKLYQVKNEFYIWWGEYGCDFSRQMKGFDNCNMYLSPKMGKKDKI